VLHLIPRYRQKVKTVKPKQVVIKEWSHDSQEALRGCFESTDWQMFYDSCSDHEELSGTVTDYIRFCEDCVVNQKTVKVFPNNKPWVTKDLKSCLVEKKYAFMCGDHSKVQEMNKEFRSKAWKAKLDYKGKVEEKLKVGNARDAWVGLNKMMGRDKKKQDLRCENQQVFANDLNKFYARFDVHNFRDECESICAPLTPCEITVDEKDVVKCFARINPFKAAGPDGLGGRVLKSCAQQLGPVFAKMFQLFLNCQFFPRSWKNSTIIPVPKKSTAKEMNDFRPVALTPILAKCMERIVCSQLLTAVADRLDPRQFAYKAKRGVEDACLTLLDLVASHLDSTGTYVRILFMDFSSAFNTIQPHLLLKRLLDLNVNSTIVLWTREFLRDRPQRVSVSGILSDELIVNTGAPQGCCLSPTLFSIYTNEIFYSDAVLTLIKFADDMALVARLRDEDSLARYFSEIQVLNDWFNESFLKLNVVKTKELICDRRRKQDAVDPVVISGESVEQVQSFKYLGTVVDSKLSFQDNTDSICKKAHQRLFLLRKLRNFGVSSQVLESVYRSLIESILTFNLIVWFGALTVRDKSRLGRVVKTASRIVGTPQKQLCDLYTMTVKKKAQKIMADSSHPLSQHFELLPSGQRLKKPVAKKNAYAKSFVPTAVTVLNECTERTRNGMRAIKRK
jgi:hypothetical protein